MQGVHLHITGIVQGVGFRPFVYNLAQRLQLMGWVKNTSAGVEIEIDGEPAQIADFVQRLQSELPPLAKIDSLRQTPLPASGFSQFEIIHSQALEGAFQPISPDVATCPDCLRELFDPQDRRYRYPFLNCTNCGPRFTIIQDIPYDRPKTTMAGFPLCADCAAEYQNPSNRRFHAQPVACPTCGPKLWLEETAPSGALHISLAEEAIQRARALLLQGKILAAKGLGGFHLACNALQPPAVAELRRRKLRVDKPFAVMMPDLQAAAEHCHLSDAERNLLLSPAHPIVLLRRRAGSSLAEQLSPGQDYVGVMLPYTPLHHLLLERAPGFPTALVMTSANLSDEPICTDNIEARTHLASLADAFLMHNRDIHIRTDDSVLRVHEAQPYPIRRSRGYAPFPVRLPRSTPPLLAAGAELKNTFCLTNGDYAFLSHHIGDLSNYETLQSFENGVRHFESLFRARPQALACDMHPNYLATRYAQERAERENLPLIPVQHHHAHIAALMAEHGLDGSQPILGVSFDGTGYGEDGNIWGGEFLLADYAGYKRLSHLPYFPLPGGDQATRRPSRTALGLLHALGIDWDETLPTHADLCYEERTAIRLQLQHNLNSPLTSSAGRLFDAVAALAGVRQRVNYEGQAAIELEALCDPQETAAYEFLPGEQAQLEGGLEALLADIRSGVEVGRVAARFHNGLANLVCQTCLQFRKETGVRQVGLSGGVWQNITLLQKTLGLLRAQGFEVLLHRQVPANDGGLALGQAVVAAQRFW